MAGEGKGLGSYPKIFRMKKLWGWLLITMGSLLLGVVLFIGVRFWFSHKPLELYPQSDVLRSFSYEDVKPSLALLSLASYDDSQIFKRALEEEELETAYVTLAFSTSMEHQERIGGWISLAQAFKAKGMRTRALLAYGQAYNIAILSPHISDPERAEALIMVGKGLEEMGEKERGLFVLRQAETLISFSPYLKKAQRIALAQKLGKEVNPNETLPEYSPPSLVTRDFSILPENYYEAEEREIAAFSAASSPSSKNLQELREALKREDAARLALYQEKIAAEAALAPKAGWVLEKIAWLTLKYRIALRGFGVSLVPEWEDEIGSIRQELSRSYEELFAIYVEEAVSLPEPREAARAWMEIANLKACYAIIGLYADAPLEKIAAEIKEAYSQEPWGSLQLVFLEDSRIFSYLGAK